MYKKSIFIFHRDFRLNDNTGLIQALKESEEVLPIFIFDQRQVVKNPYKSNNSVQFMIESLEDLDKQLREKDSRLYYFFGLTHKVLERLLKKYPAQAVYSNMDYTKFAKLRDKQVKSVCTSNNIELFLPEDYLLQPIGSITTGSDNVYSKFTPYFNKVRKVNVNEVISNKRSNYINKSLKIVGELSPNSIHKYYTLNENILELGGRKYAQKILNGIVEHKNYNKDRNDPNIRTTHLSAYIKFGCVSIREVYWEFHNKLGNGNDLIKQLYWREFYFNVGHGYPWVYDSKSLKPKYDQIKWFGKNEWLSKWKDGKTGYPIVDAGMRQMNTTGFMHNRLRLITSNFLIKVLGIDWREGEKYFAQKLYDYDWRVNNGNWQWGSGGGSDSQPYFRVFNPWTQGKVHDPDAVYIKKWIPELEDVPAEKIHQWGKYFAEYSKIDYPPPMVDYKEGREASISAYRQIS